jgi:hypothetical protein
MSAYEDNYNATVIHLIDGTEFDYANPFDVELTLHDVAHSLARVSRYNGHFMAPDYSVAEHAVLVSYLVEKFYDNKPLALAALHHDDSEAFTGDLPTPFKNFLKAQGFAWKEFENSLMVPVSKAFNIPMDDFKAGVIKDADVLAYAAEIEVLKPAGHGASPDVEPETLEQVKGFIQALPSGLAERNFAMRHQMLTGKLKIRVLEFTDDDDEPEDGGGTTKLEDMPVDPFNMPDGMPDDPFIGEDPADPR